MKLKLFKIPKKIKLYLTSALLISNLSIVSVKAKLSFPTTNKNYVKEVNEENPKEIGSSIEKEIPTVITQEETSEKEDYSQYKSTVFDGVSIDYPGSEYFYVDEALQKVSPKSNVSTTSIIKGKTVDKTALSNAILENNKSLDKKKQLDRSILNKTIDIIADSVNYELQNNPNLEIEQVDSNLKNLKIQEYSEFSYGFYNPATNVLGLNVSSLENSSGRSSFDDVLKTIVTHEAKHITQAKTSSNANIKNQFGFCAEYEDAKVNSLYCDWFFEASAEQLMMNQLGLNESFNYSADISILNSVKVATLVNPNNQSTDLEKLSLNRDMNSLFQYFDVTTEQEKKELITMFFGFNFSSHYNTSPACKKFFEVSHKTSYDSKKECAEMCTERSYLILSKFFYKNLLTQMRAGNYTMQESYELIRAYENQMNAELKLDRGVGEHSYFVQVYDQLQDIYFAEMSKDYRISQTQLESQYQQYYETKTNFKVNRLSKSTNDFYQKMQEANAYFAVGTIGSQSTQVKPK